MKKCPSCAEVIDDNDQYCKRCGEKIDTTESWDDCPYCYEEINGAGECCPSCGKELPPLSPRKKRKKLSRRKTKKSEAMNTLELLLSSYGKSHEQRVPKREKEKVIQTTKNIKGALGECVKHLYEERYFSSKLYPDKNTKALSQADISKIYEEILITATQWGFICCAIGAEGELGYMPTCKTKKYLEKVTDLYVSVLNGTFGPSNFSYEKGIAGKIRTRKVIADIEQLSQDLYEYADSLAKVGAKHSHSLTIKEIRNQQSPLSLELEKL